MYISFKGQNLLDQSTSLSTTWQTSYVYVWSLGGTLEEADCLREAVAEEDDVDEEAEALDLLHHDRGGEQGGRHCKDIQNDLGVTEPDLLPVILGNVHISF